MASRTVWLGLALVFVPAVASAADPTPQELATKAQAVFKANCVRCHGGDGSSEGGLDYMLDFAKLAAKKKIKPGKPDDSKLIQRVADDEMPPAGEVPRPSKADLETLRAWVAAGGVAAESAQKVAAREFRDDTYVLDAVRTRLRAAPENDRPYLRFFTLVNLHNNPKISDAELRLYRAALSKAANSLSDQPDIVVPEAVDKDAVVLAVDLRSLGWDRNRLWHRILTAYPYGIRQDRSGDKRLRELAKEVYLLAGSEVPALRVDWFVATATRPPLYYDLLRLPKNARELETSLNVDVGRNFGRNQLARAGFTTSGVSRQNRLVERHSASHGSYWKSYDFKSNDGLGNLYRYPLGPNFAGNTFAEQAFAHDGGEAIFNLPNGLQAYYLVDGKDNRIDVGPLEVVRDRSETSGSVAIVNGVSCMACHSKGVIDFTDAVRAGHGLGGESRAKVEDLYPELDAMKKLVEKDRKRFVTAVDEATGPFGPFVKPGGEAAKSVVEVEEPIGLLSRRYTLADLGAAEAAAELGFKDAAELVACVKANPDLRALGLGPLAAGGTIKRETWDSNSRLISAFQETAQRLDRGTPVVVR